MIDGRPPWEELERRGPDVVEVCGVAIRAGSRVRLAPRRPGGDVFELALDGRTAIVHEVLQDLDGRIQLAVTVAEDPGQDLGALRRPGHRFFFDPIELEPLESAEADAAPQLRVLVAGIGNLFLGDDGWGVALAARLSERRLPAGVEVADFGIRGMDLAYAMQEGYAAWRDPGNAVRDRAAARRHRGGCGCARDGPREGARARAHAGRVASAHAHRRL
jgi:hypothetical protein